MAERTNRGEEEDRRKDEVMGGEPTSKAGEDAAAVRPATLTRDKGVQPLPDEAEPDGREQHARK